MNINSCVFELIKKYCLNIFFIDKIVRCKKVILQIINTSMKKVGFPKFTKSKFSDKIVLS